jgi:predicted GNAT family acetyltransferase
VTLGEVDRPRLVDLLDTDPVRAIFSSSRVAQFGLAPDRLGCPVLGYERRGRLVAVMHCGSNLFLFGADPDALDAFIGALGPRSQTQSIVGPAEIVPAFAERLRDRWGLSWASPRSERLHQPVMRLDTAAAVPGDDRVHRIELADASAYFDAAVKMYPEEVGVSPLDASNSYRFYVHSLIRAGRCFGALAQSRVWFKADIGAVDRQYCQIQGVWMTPALRGHGLSEAAMSRVVELTRQSWPVVSLYVNSFNTRALRLYRHIGFKQAGELATVLY